MDATLRHYHVTGTRKPSMNGEPKTVERNYFSPNATDALQTYMADVSEIFSDKITDELDNISIQVSKRSDGLTPTPAALKACSH